MAAMNQLSDLPGAALTAPAAPEASPAGMSLGVVNGWNFMADSLKWGFHMGTQNGWYIKDNPIKLDENWG